MSKCYASKVIATAQAEVGYLEKKTNSNLTSKTANAGYNNYTKYADEIDKKYPNFYNGKKNGYSWCDVFVDWCFIKTFGVDNALELLGQPVKSCGAGCSWSAKYYKNIGRFYKSPKVGDQIFFKDSSGDPCHTGIVYKVTATTVYTIEGNTSSASGVVANGGAVATKSYSRTYNKIYGYGRPNYDPEPKAKTYSGKFPTLPKRGYLQKGDKGAEVEKLQTFLNWYGSYKLAIDGEFGTQTLAAVKNFQKKNSLEIDGKFGKNSLAKAKTIKK
ncbi:MAG: peptidoglycan-binding protein [Oscillospiraceae bacterium]|nr:peptidoglycan-binding protein [Oscillospiraceae bacterium]